MHKVSIGGDHFVLSSKFMEAPRTECQDEDLELRLHHIPWPDEPPPAQLPRDTPAPHIALVHIVRFAANLAVEKIRRILQVSPV